MVEAEVRQQIDRRLLAQGWILDPERADRDVFVERAVVPQLGPIPRRKLGSLAPDYTFVTNGVPVAVLEAKKPKTSIHEALDQGRAYAECLGVPFVFACNGPTFKSLHVPSGQPMFLNNIEVTEPLAPIRLRRFWEDQSHRVVTIPQQVIKSRDQLIELFKSLNNVLRQEGIRAGLERFTEFANLLFLKLLSERDPDNRIWHDLLMKKDAELPDYLNGFVVKKLRRQYRSDVLSQTHVGGAALKRLIVELNPLHLMSVDEDVKGVAFEHFLSRTTLVNNDLGEYFTPRAVVRFMVQLVNPQFGKTVCDPFCGTGGFLIEAFRHLGQQTPPSQRAVRILHQESLYGRELTTTARIAKMNMILFGDGHSGVVQGNSLGKLDRRTCYDYVFSNIPFSLDVEEKTLRVADPSAKDADEACLLQCFNGLKTGGAMAVVIPQGLVVNKEHEALWQRLRRESRIRVIASLPRRDVCALYGGRNQCAVSHGQRHSEYRLVLSSDPERGQGEGRDD